MQHLVPRFRRKSRAGARIVPVPLGTKPPHPNRAGRAGFGPRAGQVAEIQAHKRHLVLVRCDDDLESAASTGVARLVTRLHVAIDARDFTPDQAASLAAGAVLRAWRFDRFFTRPDPDRPLLRKLDILVDDPKAARAAWDALSPGVTGNLYARDLIIEPGNVLTPARFASRLESLDRYGIIVEVMDTERLRAEGFGGLLAVGGGSANPPCLVTLRWPGLRDVPPVLLVGKGITFDTGGVCIKPAEDMWDMRADMAGAAACAGAMLALALRRSPVPAIALLPLAENAFGAASYRPGDVLHLHGGTTVEIVDTDAEGRLILADTLSWGTKTLQPQLVVDLATLTGSVITALGFERAGLFSNSNVLAADLAATGDAVGEPVWRLPLAKGYGDDLESDIADLRQCSEGRLQPDACLAANFLNHFVGETPWAHLDIAGVESNDEAEDRHAFGPTGWGVRLLDRWIKDRIEG